MVKLITIGFRCTSDAVLSNFGLRNFSGPFSSLICDFETTMDLIKTNFENYFTDIKAFKNSDGKIKYLPYWSQSPSLFINTYYTKDDFINVPHYYIKNILLWNHHNMMDKSTIETFNRRINRILEYLKNDSCVLFYLDRVFESENLDEYIENIKCIIKKNYEYNHKILYVIPYTSTKDNDSDVKIYYEDNILKVWLLKTTPIDKLEEETKKQKKEGTPLLDTDAADKNINWKLLIESIQAHYLS